MQCPLFGGKADIGWRCRDVCFTSQKRASYCCHVLPSSVLTTLRSTSRSTGTASDQRWPPSTFSGMLAPDFGPRSALFSFDKKRGFGDAGREYLKELLLPILQFVRAYFIAFLGFSKICRWLHAT